MEAWDGQFQATGKVVIRHQFWQMIAIVVGLWAIASAALYFGTEDLDQDAYRRVVITMTVLFGLPLLWYLMVYRRRTVVIDAEGIHLTDSTVVPWNAAISAGIVRQGNRAAVGLTVTEEFMWVYRSRQSRIAGLMTGMSSALIQPNTLYFPQTLDVDMQVFATWLNSMIERHASTVPATPEPRQPVWYDALFSREDP